MSKRGLAFVLVAVMISALAIPAFGAGVPYPDVARDHWAYEAIESLHNAGLVEGYPDGTFGGERTFTRYEMAMVFDRILQRLDNRVDLLAGAGIDLDELYDEFGSELDLISALTIAVNNAQRAAAEAKDAADTAGDRAYRARLTAEQALSAASKANEAASRAIALSDADDSDPEAIRQAAQRAQRVAADAEATALRAQAIAERAFSQGSQATADAAQNAQATADAALEAAKNAEALARKAGQLAVDARTPEEAAQAAGYAEEVVQLAQDAKDQADRNKEFSLKTARLAHETNVLASEALESAEAAHGRIDEIETRLPTIGGKFGVEYTNWDDSSNDRELGRDEEDPVSKGSNLGVEMDVNVSIPASEDVTLKGELEVGNRDAMSALPGTFDLKSAKASLTTDGKFVRSLSYGKSDLEYTNTGVLSAGKEAFALQLGQDFGIVDIVLDVGHSRGDLNGDVYKDSYKIGFTEADVLGFDTALQFYTDRRHDGETESAFRAAIGREIQLGLPLNVDFVYATMDATDLADPDRNTHLAVGVDVKDLAVFNSVTLGAGVKYEDNPLTDDWTLSESYGTEQREDDNGDEYDVLNRLSANLDAELAVTKALKATGGLKFATDATNFGGTENGSLTAFTYGVGLGYDLNVLDTDITVGVDLEQQAITGGDPQKFAHEPGLKTVFTVDVARALLGGELDAGFRYVNGRGAEAAAAGKYNIDVTDILVTAKYTYPVAAGMELTVGGKYAQAEKQGEQDPLFSVTGVHAGFDVSF